MARSLKIEDVKRGDVLKLWPEDIIVKPEENGRYFEPDITDLIESIKSEGQLQPVRVRMVPNGLVQLVAGYQRYRAITIINANAPEGERMRIHAVVGDANDYEAFLQNIAENRVRNRTSAVEDARNIRRLSERFGKSDEEIRQIYAKDGKPMSQPWLDQMRKILMLSEEHQRQIHVGELSANVAFRLADMDEEARNAVLVDARAEVGPGAKITETAVLKAARKKGVLKSKVGLKSAEEKKIFEYWRDDKKTGPKTKKLLESLLKLKAGELPEPDFVRHIKRILDE